MPQDNERCDRLRSYGFTARQARFMVLVLEHSGVCLPRQYRAFCGIAHGRHTHGFFEKLIAGGFATTDLAAPAHAGRLYHLQYKPYRLRGDGKSAKRVSRHHVSVGVSRESEFVVSRSHHDRSRRLRTVVGGRIRRRMAPRLPRLLIALGLLLGAALPSAAAPVVRPPTSQEIATSPVPDRGADLAHARSYFGARYYRADIGRFTTVDPEMTLDENLVDPQKWNRYAYARNNPLKYVDPDGRWIETLWDVANVVMGAKSAVDNFRSGNILSGGKAHRPHRHGCSREDGHQGTPSRRHGGQSHPSCGLRCADCP